MQTNHSTPAAFDLRSNLFVTKIIVGTFILVPAILAAVLNSMSGRPPAENANQMYQIFMFCAFGAAAMGFFLPRFILKAALAKLPSGYGEHQKFQAWFSAVVIRGALFEAIAILGFMAGFMVKPEAAIPFFVTSALLQMLHFPAESRYRQELGTNGKAGVR